MDLLCVSFNLQIPGKFLNLFVCNFKTRKFRQASSELDSVCSDVAGVQHFVLACLQILIHAGSMPPYLPPSLVLETPLSLEIQSSARVSCSEQRDAKLFLSSWSLKNKVLSMHTCFLRIHPQEGRFPQWDANLTASLFHHCWGNSSSVFSKHSFTCDWLTSSESPEYSGPTGLATLILIFLR